MGALNPWGLGSFILVVAGLALMLDTFLPFRKPPYIVTGFVGLLFGGGLAYTAHYFLLDIPYLLFVFLMMGLLYAEIVHVHYRLRIERRGTPKK